jgi:hypothetical protein
MAQIKISIINASKTLGDKEVAAAVPALQKQVTNHFAPAWGVDADLDFVASGKKPAPGHWWLVVLDDSDDAGALGYHDVTPEGLPLGKIFAGTDKLYGNSWTVTASHELLEMLGDPAINLNALSMTEFNVNQPVIGRLWAYEVCDPCEADEDGYKIDGVLVSDFVLPSWFEGFRKPKSTQFDYRNLIKAPFELRAGGYASVYDMTSGTGWQQISEPLPRKERLPNERPPIGSRRERRRTPRNQWIKSTAFTRARAAGA